ncbi:Flp family type IVb pilin [Geopseudomonas aromaticivorans]
MELQTIKQAVVKFIKDEEGLTVVEYAVAGGMISLAVIAAFDALGVTVGGIITDLNGLLAGSRP